MTTCLLWTTAVVFLIAAWAVMLLDTNHEHEQVYGPMLACTAIVFSAMAATSQCIHAAHRISAVVRANHEVTRATLAPPEQRNVRALGPR